MKYALRDGTRWEETSFQDHFLEMLYGNMFGRCLVKLLVCPGVSQLGGVLLDTRFSGWFVPGFVKKHKLSPKDWEKQEFRSYNEFFTRRLIII